MEKNRKFEVIDDSRLLELLGHTQLALFETFDDEYMKKRIMRLEKSLIEEIKLRGFLNDNPYNKNGK